MKTKFSCVSLKFVVVVVVCGCGWLLQIDGKNDNVGVHWHREKTNKDFQFTYRYILLTPPGFKDVVCISQASLI